MRGIGEVLEPICEVVTVGEADGMGIGRCDHFKLTEVVLGKESVELAEIEEGLWQSSSNKRCLRDDEPVATSQFHFE